MKVNAKQYQGNVGERMQIPKGMQRNARERTVVGAKCQGNAGECMGMPGKRMGVSINCQGNVGNTG